MGSVRLSTSRSRDRSCSTRYGVITVPWLAMPATSIAICSGVARTSYWPIADCAVSGGFRSRGNTLGATGIGTFSRVSNPNASACLRIAASPSFIPIAPNVVLHDRCSAWVIVVWLLPGVQVPLKSLGNEMLVCGSGRVAGPGTGEVGVYCPELNAAAAVTNLNVEPGG